MRASKSIRCVLFDLDGTLADTAPDLVGALNRVRTEEGLSPVPLAQLRAFTSQGVRGLIRESYGILPDHPDYPSIAESMLRHYAANICQETRLFDGIPELLEEIEAAGAMWGVVTNKHSRFTAPLMEALGLSQRAACIVSGDSAALPKPAPDPMFLAAQTCRVAPEACVYLGDDERDIVAARAAGMPSIAVEWGYLGTEKPIETWGADHIIARPSALMDYLRSEA